MDEGIFSLYSSDNTLSGGSAEHGGVVSLLKNIHRNVCIWKRVWRPEVHDCVSITNLSEDWRRIILMSFFPT